jgi:hypothetical protein
MYIVPPDSTGVASSDPHEAPWLGQMPRSVVHAGVSVPTLALVIWVSEEKRSFCTSPPFAVQSLPA